MNAKQYAGEKAVEYVEDGMVLGLGTGSTVYWSILKIGELVKKGLAIKGIPTSVQTEKLAKEWGIPLLDIADVDRIDLTIDGADEVNPQFELIKGGGGALLREKMVASLSKQLVIVADESKYVNVLGKFPLPVEVVPFGWEVTRRQIHQLGCQSERRIKNGKPFISDNGNYILDCLFEKILDPACLNQTLNQIPGVVENGLFIQMANKVVIGSESGKVHVLQK